MSTRDKPYLPRGIDTIASGQVALNASTPTVVVAARRGRVRVVVRNLSASITVYVGDSGVDSGDGFPLFSNTPAGESVSLFTEAAVYAIAASGTPSVSYIEEYD